MRDTSNRADDRRTWPIRPVYPDPPPGATSAQLAEHKRLLEEFQAMYAAIEDAGSRRRSEFIRDLLITGWRTRQIGGIMPTRVSSQAVEPDRQLVESARPAQPPQQGDHDALLDGELG